MSGDEHDHDTPAEGAADADPGEETEQAAQAWFGTARTATCPACGAEGAMMLGEGTFCPTCGEVTTPRGPSP